MVKDTDPLLSVGDSILYLCCLLGDRRRPIDAYIDYFGDNRPKAARTPRGGWGDATRRAS